MVVFKFNPFSPSKFIKTCLLLTASIQKQLFGRENRGIHHTLQATQYKEKNYSKLFKRKVQYDY